MRDIDQALKKIVNNLWFEWATDLHLFLRKVSLYDWALFRRNLYRFLKVQSEHPQVFHRHLAEMLIQPQYMDQFNRIRNDFDQYINKQDTWFKTAHPDLTDHKIAYFSMEYGFDILRIYSGGLGILSGDHMRGSSDQDLNMIGVGLFYNQGYYEQQVAMDGEMKVLYEGTVPTKKSVRDYLPLEPVRKKGSHEELIVKVPMKDGTVLARVWQVQVGRIKLMLLDTNLPENGVHDRHITKRLYASQKKSEDERKRRLEQEIVLGIGGVMALKEAGYSISTYHLNEGHVTFAALEVLRHWIKDQKLTEDDAFQATAETVGFTTHTTVSEGNERFDEALVRSYLEPHLKTFLSSEGLNRVFNSARNRQDNFDMTKLAMILSGVYRNGVSSLHGEVCRKMWGYAWGLTEEQHEEVPIQSITNAVHVPYWQKPVLRELIKVSGGLDKVQDIADEKIWEVHEEFKKKLIDKVRERQAHQMVREQSESQAIFDRMGSLLDQDSFVIGFARRFAEYKRVTLLLDDEERLFQFLENSYKKYGKPVHIIYAGKPHPDNGSGRTKIQHITQIGQRLEARAKERNFKAQIVFVQGYDIDLARYLVAGVDIWLNNPIRPMEASGTSGMKAGMNGVLNVSIPDGWVPEGIEQGKNGWMFGEGSLESMESDRNELFQLLENEILPSYFNRGEKAFSPDWIAKMKCSIETITKKFNTDRMIQEYTERMYVPGIRNKIKWNQLKGVSA